MAPAYGSYGHMKSPVVAHVVPRAPVDGPGDSPVVGQREKALEESLEPLR